MPLNVLITGANSGFGLLTAKTFAQAGHMVHAGYRNPDKAAPLEALRSEGLAIKPVRIDITDPDSIAAGVAFAASEAPIDVLVNNAGVEVVGPVDEVSDDSVRLQFDTNVLGLVRMVRAVTPGMRAKGSGAIVNLSSLVGWMSAPYAGLYAASKHAIEALSEVMWFELRPFGIRVAVIEPGGFPTNFQNNVVIDPAFNETSPHWPTGTRFREATGRFVGQFSSVQDPQEVADLVYEAVTTSTPRLRWIAGDDARSLLPLYKSQEFEDFARVMAGTLGMPDLAP